MEKPMKALSLALSGVAAAVAFTGLPMHAHAQSAFDYGVDTTAVISDRGAWRLAQHEDWLSNRLHTALKHDDIGADQYRHLRGELDAVRDDSTRFRARQDGVLTTGQVTRLENRLDEIANRLAVLRDSGYPR
jgi:hypothetical protein